MNQTKIISTNSSNQDSLDKLVKITKPSFWWMLYSLIFLSLVAITWSIWGSISQEVDGMGLITSKSGLERIVANYPGAVINIYCKQGDTIREGDALMRISQPELLSKIQQAKLELTALYHKDTLVQQSNYLQGKNKDEIFKIEKSKLLKILNNLQTKLDFLENKSKNQKELFDKGLITRSEYESTKDLYNDVKVQVIGCQEQIHQIDLSQDEWNISKSFNINDLNNQIKLQTKLIDDLTAQYERETIIKSSVDGIVIDIYYSLGDWVSVNSSLFVLEQSTNKSNHVLDLYIPFNSNSDVEVGQTVRITPFTVNKDQYGQMLGKVIKVNRYPSSTSNLMDELGNDELVNLFNSSGPKYRILVEMYEDKNTFSGYQWTSNQGPPFKITTGTMCNASVAVKSKSPIDLLVPIFKAYWD